jgi:Sideroflexins
LPKLVPLAAVAAANCVNIPLMRMQELSEGVPVSDDNGVVYGNSVKAAQEGIAQVTLSRIFMACPGKLKINWFSRPLTNIFRFSHRNGIDASFG